LCWSFAHTLKNFTATTASYSYILLFVKAVSQYNWKCVTTWVIVSRIWSI